MKKGCCTRSNMLYSLMRDKSQENYAMCLLMPHLNCLMLTLKIYSQCQELECSYNILSLVPPTERQKLTTFTKSKDTSKKLNTKLNQATLL